MRIDAVLGIIGKVEVEEALPADIDALVQKREDAHGRLRTGKKPTQSALNSKPWVSCLRILHRVSDGIKRKLKRFFRPCSILLLNISLCRVCWPFLFLSADSSPVSSWIFRIALKPWANALAIVSGVILWPNSIWMLVILRFPMSAAWRQLTPLSWRSWNIC